MDKEPLPFAHTISEAFADYPPAEDFPGGQSVTEFLDTLYAKNAEDEKSVHGNGVTSAESSEDDENLTRNLPPIPADFKVALRIIDEPNGLATYALLLKQAQESGTTDPRLSGLQNFGENEAIFRNALVMELKDVSDELPEYDTDPDKMYDEIHRNARIIDQLNRTASPASTESGQE